jgi:hypothetical protein
LGVIARRQGWGLAEGTAVPAGWAGVPQLAGSYLKAALDADRDDPAARQTALATVLGLLRSVENFLWPRADVNHHIHPIGYPPDRRRPPPRRPPRQPR